jgi:hypothetical protein
MYNLLTLLFTYSYHTKQIGGEESKVGMIIKSPVYGLSLVRCPYAGGKREGRTQSSYIPHSHPPGGQKEGKSR